MSPDHALQLMMGMLEATLVIVGPILAATLVSGVVVGVVQTATQINEASVGYVVKAAAVVLTLLALGPTMVEKAAAYARHSIEAVATVVE